ncbi:MAG: DegV family protein [Atopobiaceae bacterium]|jgi:DegV family protein with EDD domain|nr:DegV family protein [Atopobiaceae bacterium]
MSKHKEDQHEPEASPAEDPTRGSSAPAPADGAVPAVAEKIGWAYRRKSACRIIVDSCGDFTSGVARQLGVEVIHFPFVMADGEHLDDLWQSMSPHDFYERLRLGEKVTTSAVTPGRYIEIFEKAAGEGTPTVYLCFTAGLSSSIYSAQTAAEEVRSRHPGFELYVVDNCCPSATAELLAIECVRLAGLGLSAKEIVDYANEAKYFVHGYFTLDSFDALARGGRIPPAAAQVGGKLDIKPELSYDLNGALTLKGMCRGRKKALRAIVSDFHENFSGDTSLPIAIVSTDAEKDAGWLEAAVRKEPGCEDVAVIRGAVSPAIGAHTGPGMVALCFWGSDRREKTSLSDRIAKRVHRTGDGA